MMVVFLVASLALHTLQNNSLHVGLAHCCGIKKGKQRRKIPGLKSSPHLEHCCRTKRNKVGESVLEKEDLVILVVVRANKTRLGIKS